MVTEIWSARDGIFCYFGQFLAQLLPKNPKNQNFENEKNAWRYYFKQVCQKSWSYATMFLRYGLWQMQLLFFILGYFLPFYPPKSPNNQNSKKMKKKPSKYHPFTHVYQKLWLDHVQYLRNGAQQTDGQTDGQMNRQKKWNTELGAPSKTCVMMEICCVLFTFIFPDLVWCWWHIIKQILYVFIV